MLCAPIMSTRVAKLFSTIIIHTSGARGSDKPLLLVSLFLFFGLFLRLFQVPVPSELRLQTFTVVEFLQANILHQQGGSGGSVEPDGTNPVLQLIRSAPQGGATIALLSSVVADTATNLLLNSRQRVAISSGLALPPPPASFAGPHSNPASRPAGRGPPRPGFSFPPPNGHCIPGRKRSPPPRGGLPWGRAGPRGRGGGWGREGGGRGGRGGGRLRGGM